MHREYLNFLDIKSHSEGNERRYEMLKDILSGGTFLPNTVEYKDIDEAFRDWVRGLTIINDDGKEFPTMTLFSNQRFSEYTQSWKYTDENKNVLLDFKTITRENNPQYGKIQNGLWNIPGERFYLMKKKIVLDENGSESYLVLKMRQPVAIDLLYKVSIFTTKYSSINEFNTKINKLFASRQCYIKPNGHFMAMTLENIGDESEYSINDRQFYSQSYQIKVLAYIITKEDYRVEEVPLKVGMNFNHTKVVRKRATVDMEEMEYIPLTVEEECGVKKIYLPRKTGKRQELIDIEDIVCEDKKTEYYYQPISIKTTFPSCGEHKRIILIPSDTTFAVTKVDSSIKLKSFKLFVNDEEVLKVPSIKEPLILNAGDEVKIVIDKGFLKKSDAVVNLFGYSPDVVTEEELKEIEYDYDEE